MDPIAMKEMSESDYVVYHSLQTNNVINETSNSVEKTKRSEYTQGGGQQLTD
jgi:hypothetical protein